MRLSERVYRGLLVAYPAEHRRRYCDPMTQLFRDRLRQDGGGLRTVAVWGHIGFDLACSAFRERMETAMNLHAWTSRWWEASVVALAAFFSLLLIADGDISSGYARIALAAAVLLIAGLALRTAWRVAGSALVIAGSLLAVLPWFVILNVVLAFVIVFGGFASGKFGPDPAEVTEPGT